MPSDNYRLGVEPGEVADLHDGQTPEPLRELWLKGKLTSPGAAQQGYWAQKEYAERVNDSTDDGLAPHE